MNETDVNPFFAIFGAFSGALLSPSFEILFRKYTTNGNEVFSVPNGLVLLGAANAFWALSFLIRDYANTGAIDYVSPYASIMLYTLSVVLFIGAMVQFYKTTSYPTWAAIRVSLVCLVIGNLLWLISDLSEVINWLDSSRKYLLFSGAFVLLVPSVIWCKTRNMSNIHNASLI